MTLTLAQTSAAGAVCDALLVAVRPKNRRIEVVGKALTPALATRVTAALTAMGATGKSGEITKIGGLTGFKAPMIVAVGLGEPGAKGSPEATRRAYGNAIRALGGTKKIVIVADPDPVQLQATAMGARLAAYSFTAFKSKNDPKSAPPASIAGVIASFSNSAPQATPKTGAM